jgi:hypothetical protein
MLRWMAFAVVAVALFSAAPATAEESVSCPLPDQSAMTEAELFFGLAIKGRGPVTQAEWRQFSADTLTRMFPLGFTVTDGSGQWMDSVTHHIVRERAKVVVVVAERAGLADKLSAVTRVYRARFRQQSVGIVTRPVCAAF